VQQSPPMASVPVAPVPGDGPTSGWLPTGQWWDGTGFYWWDGSQWMVLIGEDWLPLVPEPEVLA
jgi:hypothetical protein